jgi:hypothetical protein
MANIFANYSNNVIYKISCKDENLKDIYIGHTTSFYQRERLHKSNCDNPNSKTYNYKIYKIIRENGGWDNWKMEIIEKYPCKDIDEAKQRERFWIEKESSTLNITIPNRSRKEYAEIYKLINKEKISETAKLYRINNKDKIQDYIDANKEKISFQKQDWYETNKEEILQKSKEDYQQNREHKLEYQKQYAEEHKEEISQKQKEYREKNKEKLAEQKKIYRAEHKEEAAKAQKAWREANKEKLKEKNGQVIECECGNKYTFRNKSRHLKTAIHLKYQSNLCETIQPTITDDF